MGIFDIFFRNKIDLIYTEQKKIIQRLWEQMEDEEHTKDDISIEFLTNTALNINSQKMANEAAQVYNKIIPEIIEDKTIAQMFMDRFYGNLVTRGLMKVDKAKNYYSDFLNNLHTH